MNVSVQLAIQKNMGYGFYGTNITGTVLGFIWGFPLCPLQDSCGRTLNHSKDKGLLTLGPVIWYKYEVGLDTKLWLFAVILWEKTAVLFDLLYLICLIFYI